MATINLHAHSRFSDGRNTIWELALQSREVGHTMLVITDHVYRQGAPAHFSMNEYKYKEAQEQAYNASIELGNYPIVLGAEFTFAGTGEEILLYGTEGIEWLLTKRETSILHLEDLRRVRADFGVATIMAHPCNPVNFPWEYIDVLDGFEFMNNGAPMFWLKPVPEIFQHLTPWCNSDSHWAESLGMAFNFIDVPVYNEAQLLELVRSGAPTGFYSERLPMMKRDLDSYAASL